LYQILAVFVTLAMSISLQIKFIALTEFNVAYTHKTISTVVIPSLNFYVNFFDLAFGKTPCIANLSFYTFISYHITSTGYISVICKKIYILFRASVNVYL